MRFHAALMLSAATVATTLLAPAAVRAQDLDDLRERYLIEDPGDLFLAHVPRTLPGSSSMTPSGYGASWGDVFVGGGYQHEARYTDLNDGTFVVGFGLGDAQRWVGFETGIASVSTVRQGPFENTTISFKLHRRLPKNVGVSIGMENAFVLSDGADGGQSIYGALSWASGPAEWLPLAGVTATVGIGNGRFRSEDDVIADEETVNAFGSLGIQVFEPVSLIAEWTGQDVTLGLSLAPFARFPLVITPAITDVTGTAGDGARFIIGAGIGYHVPWF